MKMFCGQCGTKNEKGAAFCENCGAKLKEVSKEESKEKGLNKKTKNINSSNCYSFSSIIWLL